MAIEPRIAQHRNAAGKNVRRLTSISAGVGAWLVASISQPAAAASFDLFGVNGSFNLTGSYAYAIRLSEQSEDVIDTPGREEVPIPEELKFPNSHNFDDGDRNFEQYDPVNNRVKLFSEMQLEVTDNFGIKVSGDAFYDHVYKSDNANASPDSLNSRQQPTNSFTNEADYINGGRARLLDAYAYGTFFFGDTMSLDLKAGQHVVSWGESLFFSGVARAQGPADATRANVPGADVKSILLPVTQVSAKFSLTDDIKLLAQQKLQYQPNLLNPTGSFFSASDIIGDGAEFAYGIKNPLFLDTLAGFDLTGPNQNLQGIADLLDQALLGSTPDDGPLGGLVGGILDSPLGGILEGLPPVSLPELGNLFNAPRGLNPERIADDRPTNWDKDQWGLGIEYDLNFTTTVGYYHLNYHSHIPLPRQKFGFATLIPAQGAAPEITTEALSLRVPVQYELQYYDDIKMDALSFSTVLFSANVAGELIYRQGAPTLVDVDNGLAGPVPTPTRHDTYQLLLNGIKTFGPSSFWDSLTFVGEVGYIYADNVQPQISQSGPNRGEPYDDITSRFDQDAAAFASRIILAYNNVFPGWDLSVPFNIQGQVYNRPSLPGAFGALLGEDDYRFGVSLNFTRLQKLTLGVTYNGFWGHADEDDRPLQDRDTFGVTASYNFF